MSITDELRKYVKDHTNWDVALTTYPPQRTMTYHEGAMDAIADRIDAEHAEAQRRWMAELDAARDRDGFIELPKDADGVPIHVGDVMKGEKIGGGFCEPFEVVGYIMSNGELEPMDEHKCPRKHKYLHHHHEPTVEDVLREFALACEDAGNAGPEVARIAAEYAAKLRLVGEGE